MDTQFLESFLLVVEHGSVAEAARRLSLTPAGVTQRLKALEAELGMALVSRSGRTVRPTEAGWSILMTLFVDPGSSNDRSAKVTSGDLDAAVIVEPQFALPKTCAWETWREEPLIVLAHRGIAETDPHKILQSQPYIRYDRKQWGGRLADEYLEQNKLTVQDRYELDSLETIAVLVDRQLGVSLVPDWVPPWPEGLTLKKIPLPHAREKRRVGLLWRRSSPRIRLVQALLAEAKRHEIAGPPVLRRKAG